jgi:hypothetical protein
MGEERLKALLQESLAVATRTQAMKPKDLTRVIIDTTVQPKAVAFPTDPKLLNRARERLVKLARQTGIDPAVASWRLSSTSATPMPISSSGQTRPCTSLRLISAG